MQSLQEEGGLPGEVNKAVAAFTLALGGSKDIGTEAMRDELLRRQKELNGAAERLRDYAPACAYSPEEEGGEGFLSNSLHCLTNAEAMYIVRVERDAVATLLHELKSRG
ncbi:hypothetical protein B484DRAFT_393306 [Ochromonadaceae sp. CCMP2298]|nr:hypothetical protein B484DRAFT_393306 [Ochromonadaceae sp. CCMP2298]